MESVRPGLTRRTGRPSFNGATAFRRWKVCLRCWAPSRGRGFNGATAFRRWKGVYGAVRLRAVVASMGPPPFGDGKRSCLRGMLRRVSCFNGATAFRRWKAFNLVLRITGYRKLQWGHRLSAMERFRAPATHLRSRRLQWGHRLSAMERGLPEPDISAQERASMGPPPFGDGKLLNSIQSWLRPIRFNGATAFRRWKAPPKSPRLSWSFQLQWGHRLSAMESPSRANAQRLRIQLQWGHRLSAMESLKRFLNRARISPLQWGHRLSAMESACDQLTLWGLAVASMGPPPFGDGKPDGDLDVGPGSSASMGPPPFGDGKVLSPVILYSLRLASMGPPPFGDGKS